LCCHHHLHGAVLGWLIAGKEENHVGKVLHAVPIRQELAWFGHGHSYGEVPRSLTFIFHGVTPRRRVRMSGPLDSSACIYCGPETPQASPPSFSATPAIQPPQSSSG